MTVKAVQSIEERLVGYETPLKPKVQPEQVRKPQAGDANQPAHNASVLKQWGSKDNQILEEAQESLKKRLEAKGVNFEFRLLEQDGGLQVEVRDGKSGAVLQRFPPDSLLKLKDMDVKQAGAFFHRLF